MRTHARDLASTDEILQMMGREAVRKPTSDKHFADFSVVKEWLEAIKVKTDLFEKVTLDEINAEVERVKPVLVKKTLEHAPIEIVVKVERYLGEEDEVQKADIAIVFGGRTLVRAEKGAELYLQGYVPKLLMCGKSPNYKSFFDVPEAIAYKNRAMELNVPEEDIFTEPNSINIPDNVRSSLNLLDEINFDYKSVIQVISWYANRRAWCTLKKYLDTKVELIRVNAPLPADSKYKQGEWYKTDVGIEIIFNEFVKMKHQSVTERV